MSDGLTRSQQVLMWELFAAGGERLNKDIVPAPDKKDREALAKRGLVKVRDSGRTKSIELEDRGWRWIADSDPFPIAQDEKRVTAERRLLQSLMRNVKRYAETRGITLQDLFRVSEVHAAFGAPVSKDGDRSPSKDTIVEEDDIEAAVTAAFFDIAGRPARGNIRLSQLRSKLGHMSREKVDATLVAMWRAKKANLMNLDNPRDIDAESDAALKTGVHTFHVVRITE